MNPFKEYIKKCIDAYKEVSNEKKKIKGKELPKKILELPNILKNNITINNNFPLITNISYENSINILINENYINNDENYIITQNKLENNSDNN